MPFPFYCPQGHLLEGHESQMGQQGQCPMCGMLFVIPVIQAPSAETPGYVQPGSTPWFPPANPGAVDDPPPSIDVTQPPPAGAGGAATQQGGDPQPAPGEPPAEPEKREPEILHIPCPKGHELETPEDMLGQEVICPLCQTQFRLRREDSIEHQRQQAELRQLREQRFNKAVLRWSIVIAVLILLAVASMIVYVATK